MIACFWHHQHADQSTAREKFNLTILNRFCRCHHYWNGHRKLHSYRIVRMAERVGLRCRRRRRHAKATKISSRTSSCSSLSQYLRDLSASSIAELACQTRIYGDEHPFRLMIRIESTTRATTTTRGSSESSLETLALLSFKLLLVDSSFYRPNMR